jgi:hypothetical protein
MDGNNTSYEMILDIIAEMIKKYIRSKIHTSKEGIQNG